MTQPKRRPRLDDDQRKVLEYLAQQTNDNGGRWVRSVKIQQDTVWPIRPVLHSLKRRGLVEHDGEHDLVMRFWAITDAGREAIS